MQRVFRLVAVADLKPVGTRTTRGFDRSVAHHGVINPVTMADVADGDGGMMLEIIDGNRRVRAARRTGFPKIPAVVLKDTTADERAALTLMTNHLRSLNFYTESLAVSALAANQVEPWRIATALGIAPSKLGAMLNKIEGMPDDVRRAMYEERIPVTAAKSIAEWPLALQDEVVALLRQRVRLDTHTIKRLKVEYERRHPAGFRHERSGKTVAAPAPVAGEAWSGVEPVTFDGTGGSPASPGASSAATPEPPVAEIAPVPFAATATPESVAAPQETDNDTSPPTAEDPRIFLTRLDEELLRLARDTRLHSLSRSAWVDRTMRAWDLTEAG